MSESQDVGQVRALYERSKQRHARARERLARPLTLTEKVLWAHADDPEAPLPERGVSFLDLRPDRVAMQDATAQMALLQFMLAGKDEAQVPSTVHCDHLIQARVGAAEDLKQANTTNGEVYAFLESVSRRYGIGFWKPGAGIIHQVVLEHYAFPGGLMIGTDSHTPNAGGMGMIACGVGGADAVDVMVGMPWEVLCPRLVGVHLKGQLSGWSSPKDVILKLCEILTCAGGTNKVIEYFGPGVASISLTGRATITNMGAELGATTSIFPYDGRTAAYLRATGRAELAALADEHAALLVADPEVAERPRAFYDELIELDLSTLEPHVVGPFTPDLARPVSRMGADAREHGWPLELTSTLIGSCTNSSYEDISRAAHLARQAKAKGLKAKVPFLVTPGSEQIRATIARDGQLEDLTSIGATVLANACGPCIGQWKRDDVQKGTKNSIITSFNRNFKARNDSNPDTHAFIASPEVVTAYAFSGSLGWNPLKDELPVPGGGTFRFAPPEGDELPKGGFTGGDDGFVGPDPAGKGVQVAVSPTSDRLQLLAPFPAWEGTDLTGLALLLKAKGKCTMDHISAAGPWLKFRGHLQNISDNAFLTAVNAFTGEVGKGLDVLDGMRTKTFPEIGKHYKQAGQGWVVVGDVNYGEGSSREHAAMSPRYLGCRAVITRSFARIHETNLKKQGILPLTFANPDDYERVREDDRLDVVGLTTLAAGSKVELVLHHADGSTERVLVRHSLAGEQIEWFKAGSALNLIRQRAGS